MPHIIMHRGFIARWTRMPHSTGRLSASATSYHSLSSAAFITNIAESDFRHAQVARPSSVHRHWRRKGFVSAGSSRQRLSQATSDEKLRGWLDGHDRAAAMRMAPEISLSTGRQGRVAVAPLCAETHSRTPYPSAKPMIRAITISLEAAVMPPTTVAKVPAQLRLLLTSQAAKGPTGPTPTR